MIRKQEKIRRNNVYQATKQRISDKPYNRKTTEVFAEVAEAFGYEPRSVSNIYYAFRKEEEKQLHKIRVEGKVIAQWFKENVTKWHELTVQSSSVSQVKKDFSVNPLPRPGEYSFDFWVEANYKVVKSGDGKNQPIEHDVTIGDYHVELTAVFNDDGEELILKQKYIQEIEDHLYSVLKLEINYNG